LIIKQDNKVGIFDTKGGLTLEVAKQKAEALYNYYQYKFNTLCDKISKF
jgi:hypothetical protein